MSSELQGAFISQKINKVRWIPEEYVDTKCFITGSWDDDVNSIKVWTFESTNEVKDVEYPTALSEYKIEGDVSEIKFIDKNRIATSSSEGDVRILEISVYDNQTPLKEIHIWKKLHSYESENCACTALDTLEGDVATVGENGVLNVLNSRRGDIAFTVKNADSCSIHSVCYMKHNELITGNIRGHMKIWDLRTPSEKCIASFLLSGDEQAATSIVCHPTQPHIIVAGNELGSVTVWDIRMKAYPATTLTAHSGAITEMKFHPENPTTFFSCAASGELWSWNMESMIKSSKGPDDKTVTSWRPVDEKNRKVKSLIPPIHKAINSLDCDRGRILLGCDNEAVYLIKNVGY